MTERRDPTPPALSGHRDRAVTLLCGHFAADRLTVEEFERRVDAAHRAASLAELAALTADLAALETAAPATSAAPRPAQAPTPDAGRDERQYLLAVMGGVERRGRWRPGRNVLVTAVMGGAELDFREAVLEEGVTEIYIFCMMGGVEIVVPPDLAVDANGVAIMGGFAHSSPSAGRPGGPVLRVRGLCAMGGVEIEVRLPGETAREATARRKAERQLRALERRRLERGG